MKVGKSLLLLVFIICCLPSCDDSFSESNSENKSDSLSTVTNEEAMKIANDIASVSTKQDFALYKNHLFRINASSSWYIRSYLYDNNQIKNISDKSSNVSTTIDYFSDTNNFKYTSNIYSNGFINTLGDRLHGDNIKSIINLEYIFSSDLSSCTKTLSILENVYDYSDNKYQEVGNIIPSDDRTFNFYEYCEDASNILKLHNLISDEFLVKYCDRSDEFLYINSIANGDYNKDVENSYWIFKRYKEDNSALYINNSNTFFSFELYKKEDVVYDSYKMNILYSLNIVWGSSGNQYFAFSEMKKETKEYFDGTIEEVYFKKGYTRNIIDYLVLDPDNSLFFNGPIKQKDYYLDENNRYYSTNKIDYGLPNVPEFNKITFAEQARLDFLSLAPNYK